MPAGGGAGTSDVSPAGSYWGGGGWNIFLGEAADIRSYGINIPGPGGPWFNIPDLDLPVGLGGISVLKPSLVISEVDEGKEWIESTDVPESVDRRDQPLNEENVALSDQEWWEMMFPGVPYVPPVTTVTEPAPLPPPPPLPEPDAVLVTGEEPVSWIEDVYGTVDQALGGILPGGVAPTIQPFPAYNIGVPTVQVPTPVPGTGGPVLPPPPSPPVSACSADDPMKGMVWSKRCGVWGWHKKKHRRRKRLATASDIKDLNALQNVFGNGKALQAWIATH